LNASTRIAADAEAFEDDRLDIQALEEREQIPARLRDLLILIRDRHVGGPGTRWAISHR